ncbi:hypothetical protein IEO21_04129 [Rhodonia placenta]|uniref:C2H2-type domain-containing protein n=1 Tax=Rhodonia placenta TaxID=104341 RepID=A0A8H7P4J0_9APHY|nr:hypothetical protein IEO21_04129 [Postia placenta]
MDRHLQCYQCSRWFRNRSGLTQHLNSRHVRFPSPAQAEINALADGVDAGQQEEEVVENTTSRRFKQKHPYLTAQPCDADGKLLPPNTAPLPWSLRPADDWTPYTSRAAFELTEFLFRHVQMSKSDINTLMDLWAASMLPYGSQPPFDSVENMYSTIDATELGDAPWESFVGEYTGPQPDDDVPSWMSTKYHIWKRDVRTVLHHLLGNPTFDGEIDLVPYRDFDADGERQFVNVMSADWAYRQADKIAEDPTTHGAMFAPILLGSDKTTVSVATGQNEYYPLYLSLGNITNRTRRAHRNAVVIIAFLAIPKCTC